MKQIVTFLFVVLNLLLISQPLFAQFMQPGTNLPCRTYGTESSERAFALVQSSDFGYVLAGWTSAFTTAPNDTNVLIIKTDSLGVPITARISIGPAAEEAHSMVRTTDDGYAVTGWTKSYGAGGSDIFVLKLDANLNLQWGRVYGGEENDQAYSIIQTSDDGYAVTGWTNSFGDNPKPNIIVMKLLQNGDVQWAKAYARQVPQHKDEGYGITELPGGYAVVGRFHCAIYPDWDAFLMYLDSIGNLLGTEVLWGPKDDEAYSVTFDGNIEVAGWTGTYGVTPDDSASIFVANFPPTPGPPIWRNVYGWENEEKVMDDKSLIVTNDGNYAVSGWTCSAGPGVPNPNFLIMKLNSSNGSVIWSRVHPSIPGANSEEAYPMIQTLNGGYAIAGYTNSFGLGGDDFHFLTLDQDGNRPVCVLDTMPIIGTCDWMVDSMYVWEANPDTTLMPLSDAMVQSVIVCGGPTITVGSLSGFGNVLINTTSAEKSYTVEGSDLTPASGNITVTPPTSFEVSTSEGGPYSSSAITIAYSGGSLASTPVYVVFKPTLAQLYSGNITNAGGGATTKNVAVSGTGTVPPATPTLASPSNGATGVSTSPTLSWNTSSGATSYQLQVSTSSEFSTTVVDQSGISDTSYSITGLANNTLYYWRVNATNEGGTSSFSNTSSFTTVGPTSVEQLDSDIPLTFALYQNYPNPFNPSTIIEYHIPYQAFVKLNVFDILGCEVAVLVNENKSPGRYNVTFDASNLPGGIYLYHVQAGNFQETRKLVLLK